MSCSGPGAIAPEDLVAFAEGEADQAIAAHVARCPQCAAEARQYVQAQGRLRGALRRFDCPSPHTIGEYELGLLADAERARVAQHLLECPLCTDELRTLRQFLATDTTPQPSPLDRLRRVVATLWEPPRQAAYAGLRGAEDAAARVYRAGSTTLTISPTPSGRRGQVALVGLIWDEGESTGAPTPGEAQLIAPTGATRSVPIDELGNFSFDEVAPGVYRLEVQRADQMIVIEDLPVGG